jgi:hypothetical protein
VFEPFSSDWQRHKSTLKLTCRPSSVSYTSGDQRAHCSWIQALVIALTRTSSQGPRPPPSARAPNSSLSVSAGPDVPPSHSVHLSSKPDTRIDP